MVLAGATTIVAGAALAVGLVATSSSGGSPAVPAPAVSTSAPASGPGVNPAAPGPPAQAR
jgi:hypothetical protein